MAFNIASNVLAFIIVLGFLIFAHEAGHFFVAKLFRVRVLVFSFGLGKRLFGIERGGTDYRVSLVPLGGYVRMAGDTPDEQSQNVLEGHNEEGLAHGAPDEFLSRPKWQRFLILFAGPAMNVVIAIVFLTWMGMAGQEQLRESEPIIGTVVPKTPAAAAGLQTGDRITTVDQESIRSWDDLRLAISMNPATPITLTLTRSGQTITTTLTPERVVTDLGVAGRAGITPFMTTEVGRVLPDTAASRAGLARGDLILAVDGKPVQHQDQFLQALNANKGQPARLQVSRAGGVLEVTLPAMKSKKEFYPGIIPPTTIRKLGLGDAFRESLSQNWKMVKYTFVVIGRLFRAEGSVKDFSGPISIARISGEMLRTGWKQVIFLMAVISLNLGVMNLLPIPVLDGGHIFILMLEGVARREFSLRTKERVQQVGFAMLAALMIVVLFNDVIQNVILFRRG